MNRRMGEWRINRLKNSRLLYYLCFSSINGNPTRKYLFNLKFSAVRVMCIWLRPDTHDSDALLHFGLKMHYYILVLNCDKFCYVIIIIEGDVKRWDFKFVARQWRCLCPIKSKQCQWQLHNVCKCYKWRQTEQPQLFSL